MHFFPRRLIRRAAEGHPLRSFSRVNHFSVILIFTPVFILQKDRPFVPFLEPLSISGFLAGKPNFRLGIQASLLGELATWEVGNQISGSSLEVKKPLKKERRPRCSVPTSRLDRLDHRHIPIRHFQTMEESWIHGASGYQFTVGIANQFSVGFEDLLNP